MGKVIDLTGQRFGKLTVIERTAKPEGIKRTTTYWLCKCDCGNTKIANSSDLRRGDTTSCGCVHNEVRKSKAKDLIGQRFGRLTVIAKSEKRDKSGWVQWICRCDCGNEIVVNSGNLKKENTKSCGCLFTETMSSDKNPMWKGGICSIREYLGAKVEYWFSNAKQQANYTCQLTGKKGCILHTHHLYAFGLIIQDAHTKNNIPIHSQIGEYTQDELQILTDYVKWWHKDNSNAVVLCKEAHNLFHKIYGAGGNTPEQYMEFKQRYDDGEFKEIL